MHLKHRYTQLIFGASCHNKMDFGKYQLFSVGIFAILILSTPCPKPINIDPIYFSFFFIIII